MPKAILEFDLPEERADHSTALNGWKYRYILSDLDNELRSKLKHGDYSEEVDKAYQEIRDYIHEAIWQYNLGDLHGED